jgi:hypothetical protein
LPPASKVADQFAGNSGAILGWGRTVSGKDRRQLISEMCPLIEVNGNSSSAIPWHIIGIQLPEVFVFLRWIIECSATSCRPDYNELTVQRNNNGQAWFKCRRSTHLRKCYWKKHMRSNIYATCQQHKGEII